MVPVAATQTTARVYDDADKLLLPYLTSAMAAGNYAAIYKLLAYSLLPVRAVTMALMPSLMERRDHDGVADFLRGALTKVIGVSAVAVLLLAAAALLGISAIFGEAFSTDVYVVVPLAVAFLLRSAHYTVADVLYATNRDYLRLLVQSALSVVSLAITTILIIRYAAVGAAVATMVMEILALLGYAWLVTRRTSDERLPVQGRDVAASTPLGGR
jgi:O-antigen/teichoic acid export membrane protein